ncbi:MAG: kynureninase/PvdN C-terminal domain-containing protein, partial [Solirubrobacteraceae bacterium]
FAMAAGYVPADGVRAVISGTPNVLGLVAVEEGARLVAEAGIDRIRAKAVALTDFAIELADARLSGNGFTVGSPREAAGRGAHVALRHPAAAELCVRLAERGVIVDHRPPDVIRLGLAPLTTRFVDVHEGIDRLHGVASVV